MHQGSAGGLEKNKLEIKHCEGAPTNPFGISSLSSSDFNFFKEFLCLFSKKRKTLYLQIEEEEERFLENFGVNNFLVTS